MDISVIDADKTTTATGIVYGATDAPKKMIEFINLACPYCRQWFEESYEILDEAVQKGQLQRIIKLFDKEKESLQRGNVMHHHLSSKDGQKAMEEIRQIFATQEEWKNLSLQEVADYATEKLGLSYQKDEQTSQSIIDEAANANIRFVPTIILGENIFDESISLEELSHLLHEK
ncbi:MULTISPECIES: thioredoxin domain-containing protein [unclassified Enterococcus]|uniref:thioredoxin domain-containing protein n=1 Tax=unclassified Enterococcus TaxID=2608891 RepID=UPI0013EA4BC1|nr:MULTISPECIES: thioredoxin domain-containing protein [unclassified Enterococcus]